MEKIVAENKTVVAVASVPPQVSPQENGVVAGGSPSVASVASVSIGETTWGNEYALPEIAQASLSRRMPWGNLQRL